MKPYLTIKRNKEEIAVTAEHDNVVAANEHRYKKNTSDPDDYHVYETWTREKWEMSSERKSTPSGKRGE